MVKNNLKNIITMSSLFLLIFSSISFAQNWDNYEGRLHPDGKFHNLDGRLNKNGKFHNLDGQLNNKYNQRAPKNIKVKKYL